MVGISRFIQQLGCQEGLSMSRWQWTLISLVTITMLIGIMFLIRDIDHHEYPIDNVMNASHYINETHMNVSSV